MILAIIGVTPAIVIFVPSDVQRIEAVAPVGSTKNGDHVAVQSTQTKSLLNESQVRAWVGFVPIHYDGCVCGLCHTAHT